MTDTTGNPENSGPQPIPEQPQAQPASEPFPSQPFPSQPFAAQPLPGQPLPGQPVAGQPFPGPPAPGPWGAPGPFPPGFAPVPAKPGFFATLPLAYKLSLGAAVFGIITFFMGFVAWVSIDEEIGRRMEEWGEDHLANGAVDVPAFLTVIFSPGYFLIGIGAAAFAAIGVIVRKWRKYLPHVAFFTVLCWLGLIASGLALPPFINLGAGAIVSLIFGTIQFLLIGVATLLAGSSEDDD